MYIFNLNKKESDLLYQSRNSDALTLTNKSILIGAYLGIFISLQQGSLLCLSWIPKSWGRVDEYGDFISLGSTLSGILALFGTWYLVSNIESLFRYRLISSIQREEAEYRAKINNPYSDIEAIKKEIKELHVYQANIIVNKNPVCDGRFRLVAQEKELIYRRLLEVLDRRKSNNGA